MEVFPSLTVKPDSATPYTDATQVSQIWLKILQQVDFKFYIHDQAGLRGSIFSMEASSLKLSEFLENACGHKLMTCRHLKAVVLRQFIRTNQGACALC